MNTILSVNYYDDYSFAGVPLSFLTPAGTSSVSNRTKGLITATRTAVLNTVGNPSPDLLWSVTYYDDLGRGIKTFAQHYLGGTLSSYNYDLITTTYNFVNQPITAIRQQNIKNSGNTASTLAVTINNTYNYDHVGRKRQTFEQINSGANVLLVDDEYNEIGQLMTKNLYSTDNGNSYLQNTSYTYNERGWLSKINDPSVPPTSKTLFAEQLSYNNPAYGAPAQYNGNIAEQVCANVNGGIVTNNHTNYSYDPLNRLTAGIASAGNSETGINYDVLGNISALSRSGFRSEALSYKYTDVNNNSTGNALQKVTNSNTAAVLRNYTYDNNGNALSDGTNTFTYNLLNLPTTVNSSVYNVSYTYDADGKKLRKVSTQVSNGLVTTTDYISGIQYKSNSTTIDFIQTEEGRIINNGGSWNYEYTLTDHLGNNRVTFDQLNGKTNENDYYPFGYDVPKLVNGTNYYLYNKKELQPEFTQYDYGARFYDPVIGRFNNIDRFSEKYYNLTSYHYCANNPINNIDVNGDTVIDKDHIVSNLKDNINQQIATVNGLIKSGAITADFAAGYLGELNGTLSDITTLENSTVNYNVYNDASGNTAEGQGETRYNKSTGNVDIAFGEGVKPNDIYLQAHELVHGVQFENGEISLNANGNGAGSLVDITDEVSANNRQSGLAAGLYGYANRTVYTVESLKNKVFPDGTKPYQSLKDGPVNINSIQGIYLRLRTTVEGQKGVPQTEIYIGSKKDYNAGKALNNSN